MEWAWLVLDTGLVLMGFVSSDWAPLCSWSRLFLCSQVLHRKQTQHTRSYLYKINMIFLE